MSRTPFDEPTTVGMAAYADAEAPQFPQRSPGTDARPAAGVVKAAAVGLALLLAVLALWRYVP